MLRRMFDLSNIWIGAGIFVLFIWAVIVLSGCASSVPRMKAESRADVVGDVMMVEETITTNPDGTTSRVVKTTLMSAAGADLDLKKTELKGRTEIGVAQANQTKVVYSSSSRHHDGIHYGEYPPWRNGGGTPFRSGRSYWTPNGMYLEGGSVTTRR